jgi:hypothetical protein
MDLYLKTEINFDNLLNKLSNKKVQRFQWMTGGWTFVCYYYYHHNRCIESYHSNRDVALLRFFLKVHINLRVNRNARTKGRQSLG